MTLIRFCEKRSIWKIIRQFNVPNGRILKIRLFAELDWSFATLHLRITLSFAKLDLRQKQDP